MFELGGYYLGFIARKKANFGNFRYYLVFFSIFRTYKTFSVNKQNLAKRTFQKLFKKRIKITSKCGRESID